MNKKIVKLIRTISESTGIPEKELKRRYTKTPWNLKHKFGEKYLKQGVNL
jgi:translation initiation factor 2 alpha subunit (eIF-2alpha)